MFGYLIRHAIESFPIDIGKKTQLLQRLLRIMLTRRDGK